MLNFYYCGRYRRILDFRRKAHVIEALDYHCCSSWLLDDPSDQNEDLDSDAGSQAAREVAERDLADVAQADFLVCASEVARQPTTNRGGRFVEQGYALGVGIPLYLYPAEPGQVTSAIENVFHRCDGVIAFPSFDALFFRLLTASADRQARFRN